MSQEADLAAVLADLKALADGRLPLDAYGAWVPPQDRADGTKSWPYVAYTARFHAAQTQLDRIIKDSIADYVTWQAEFAGPLDDPATIAKMTRHDLIH